MFYTNHCAVPRTTSEKEEFRASVRALRRTGANGAVIKGEEANFDEAEAMAYQAYALTQVSLWVKVGCLLVDLSDSLLTRRCRRTCVRSWRTLPLARVSLPPPPATGSWWRPCETSSPRVS